MDTYEAPVKRDVIERVTNRERKRIKSSIKQKQICIEYHKTGNCKFGDSCKFTHGEITSETKELIGSLMKEKCQSTLREQSYKRSLMKQRDTSIDMLCKYFNDCSLSSSLRSPSLRYYSRFFVKRSENDICLDQYVLFNPNGICAIGLAESHDLIRKHRTCNSLLWGTTRQHKVIQSNSISGKSKKGGIWLDEDDVVCSIEDDMKMKYNIVAGVRGRLFELNDLIEEDPTIVSRKPSTSGYICIIQPKFNDIDYLLNKLLSLEHYCESFS